MKLYHIHNGDTVTEFSDDDEKEALEWFAVEFADEIDPSCETAIEQVGWTFGEIDYYGNRGWERIMLQPYTGVESSCCALIDETGMRLYFSEIYDECCRCCFQADNDSPLVDYEIPWEELEEWHKGKRGLVLTAIEHDPECFPELVMIDWRDYESN